MGQMWFLAILLVRSTKNTFELFSIWGRQAGVSACSRDSPKRITWPWLWLSLITVIQLLFDKYKHNE